MKYFLLPVAAFAVMTTSVSAFSAEKLAALDVDLTDTQIAALEEAHELRQAGAERSEIKTVLEDADIDRELLREIRQAGREHRAEVRAEIRAALEAEDFDAYRDAVADTRQGDVVDTEAEFDQLLEAFALREAGDREAAREIMQDLGFERPDREHRGHRAAQ